jgi:hypothetical protein
MERTLYLVMSTEEGPKLIETYKFHWGYQFQSNMPWADTPEVAWQIYESKERAEFLMSNLKKLKEMKNETKKEPPG